MKEKVKIAIIGASGYSGEELLRILLKHPQVEVKCITSRQYAGQVIGDVFPRFAESSLTFSAPSVEEIAAAADVAFLALPHGVAAEFAVPLVEKGVKVIDISADFRLKSGEKYKQYYKADHPAPHLMEASVYGSPERKRQQIADSQLVACPGCYPTSIVLPLYPLLKEGLVEVNNIVVSSMSGVTGAGRKVAVDYIFPECNESVRPYAPTGHRHLPEIEQELAESAGVDNVAINFIPHLIPVNRGIHSTIIARMKEGLTSEAVYDCWQKYYAEESFVRVLPMGKLADTKHVTYTNICEIGFACDEHTGNIVLSSAIDNLTKGASGQAVQCMNIMFGLEETLGL